MHPPTQHGIEEDAQGPDVNSLVVVLGLVKYFRGSILSRSTPCLQLGSRIPEVAQPKVSNYHFSLLLVQEDVLQLDVPVYDAFAVDVTQALHHLFEEHPCLLLLQFPIGMVLHQVTEVATREEVQG